MCMILRKLESIQAPCDPRVETHGDMDDGMIWKAAIYIYRRPTNSWRMNLPEQNEVIQILANSNRPGQSLHPTENS